MPTINNTPIKASLGGVRTPAERLALARRARAAWKGSVKSSLKALAVARKGWDRKIA